MKVKPSRKELEEKIKKLEAKVAGNQKPDDPLGEELLQESEERFRLLSEAAFEAVIIHKDGVLLKANDQFFEMFGYRSEELLGTQVVTRVIADESIEFVKKQIDVQKWPHLMKQWEARQERG